MATNRQQGQILLEVCVVSFFLALVAFAAIGHLEEIKPTQQKYKFTKDANNVQKVSAKNKK